MQDVWISPGLFFRYICQPDNCLRYGKVLAQRWQTIPERGVVRSCEPFKFRWVPTVSLERLIVSGAVNLVRRWVSQTSDGRRTSVDHTRRRDLYSAARPSKRNRLITIWRGTKYLACAEPLRHAGLSAAAETLVASGVNTYDMPGDFIAFCQKLDHDVVWRQLSEGYLSQQRPPSESSSSSGPTKI